MRAEQELAHLQQQAQMAQMEFVRDFLLTHAYRYIDRPNVRCHECGFAPWAASTTVSLFPPVAGIKPKESINASFICAQCENMLCLACGCTETSPCVNERTNQPCGWSIPGFCSACVNQIVMFAYDEATGRIDPQARPFVVSRQVRVIHGQMATN